MFSSANMQLLSGCTIYVYSDRYMSATIPLEMTEIYHSSAQSSSERVVTFAIICEFCSRPDQTAEKHGEL